MEVPSTETFYPQLHKVQIAVDTSKIQHMGADENILMSLSRNVCLQ